MEQYIELWLDLWSLVFYYSDRILLNYKNFHNLFEQKYFQGIIFLDTNISILSGLLKPIQQWPERGVHCAGTWTGSASPHSRTATIFTAYILESGSTADVAEHIPQVKTTVHSFCDRKPRIAVGYDLWSFVYDLTYSRIFSASPTTPSTHRGSAHSTPTRNFFMSNSRQNSNNYNEMMFGRADSRESAREERGAPLARITSPSASDSTQSASQSPSPSPTVTATVMSHRKKWVFEKFWCTFHVNFHFTEYNWPFSRQYFILKSLIILCSILFTPVIIFPYD